MTDNWHTQIRVQMAHTDCTGVVYHANYLNFMEMARSELFSRLCQEHGLTVPQFYQMYGFFVVHGVNITYKQPLRLADKATVVSRVDKRSRVQTVWHQAVYRGDSANKQLCTDAQVKLAFVNKAMRPAKMPDWLWSTNTEVST